MGWTNECNMAEQDARFLRGILQAIEDRGGTVTRKQLLEIFSRGSWPFEELRADGLMVFNAHDFSITEKGRAVLNGARG